MNLVQLFVILAFWAGLAYLEYNNCKAALAAVSHMPAFLSYQTLECYFKQHKSWFALTVCIYREGPCAGQARRVLIYSKLRYRFVMSNPKQRLGFVLHSISLRYKTM